MKIRLLILMVLLISNTAKATDISQASDMICNKIKTCGIAQIKQQDLTPEIAQFMQSMFEGMCSTMVAPYVNKATNDGLEKKVIACLDTINDMSCDDLMQGRGEDTPECQTLKEAAEESESTTSD